MLQVLPMRTLASYLRRYASETYVDAMNRDPNVVTKGLGERMVKPATEILWAGFFCLVDGERQVEEERP